MLKWEQLEEYLFEADAAGTSFNAIALADDMGCTPHEASGYIQAYLSAQTHRDSNTLYVLNREAGTRTASAMWHVGVRTADMHDLGFQAIDDFRTRLRRYVAPTLERMGAVNPRGARHAEAILRGLEAGVDLLFSILTDGEDEDHAIRSNGGAA